LYDSIKDADCEGGGNGYTFASYSAWDMLCALRNALNCYADKAAWKKLVRRVMLTDFSWDVSAGKYTELYRSL
jgi:starch synthase